MYDLSESETSLYFFFFFNDTATTEIYTLSLHDALPICTLDWSEKINSKERYDLVIGCEVFYDEAILADISRVLEQVLAPGGKGIFCDPNRLGLDTIELGFKIGRAHV